MVASNIAADSTPKLKPRPYRSLFDCSATLQKLFDEDPYPNRAGKRDGTDDAPRDPLSQLLKPPHKQQLKRQDSWSKGTDSVQQMRRQCKHLYFPTFDPIEDDFQLNEPTCFFVVNEYLWTKYRPESLHSQTLCYSIRSEQAKSSSKDFHLMLDVNRCFFLTSAKHCSKLQQDGPFQRSLIDMCKIQPENLLSEQEKDCRKRAQDAFEENIKHNRLYDSGLSQMQERHALVFGLLFHIHQLRGLLYYRLLKVMVIVGHNDIECCYLMPHKPEEQRGVLADEYY